MCALAPIASTLSLALLLAGPCLAQQPATPAPAANPPAGGLPEKILFDIPYGAPITLECASEALAAVEAEALKRNWKFDIAVVDPNGDLLLFARTDGGAGRWSA